LPYLQKRAYMNETGGAGEVWYTAYIAYREASSASSMWYRDRGFLEFFLNPHVPSLNIYMRYGRKDFPRSLNSPSSCHAPLRFFASFVGSAPAAAVAAAAGLVPRE
jgi:hypothetical protein